MLIDAGSSGSRVHIFSYSLSSDPAAPYASVTLPDPQMKTTPGLSSFAPDGAGAGVSLHKLIQFAQAEVRFRVLYTESGSYRYCRDAQLGFEDQIPGIVSPCCSWFVTVMGNRSMWMDPIFLCRTTFLDVCSIHYSSRSVRALNSCRHVA